jgi:long-chain acyl-CoA synthetase
MSSAIAAGKRIPIVPRPQPHLLALDSFAIGKRDAGAYGRSMTTETTEATTFDTVAAAFAETAARHASEPAIRSADGAVDWTWGEYWRRAREAAAALAGLGVEHRDTVALWLTNRPEFHVADSGAMLLGGAPFSVYSTFTVEQAEHVIGDAGARILITEPAFLESALAVRDSGRTDVKTVVLVEGSHAEAMSWQELLDCAEEGFDVEAASARVGPDDLVTLIYTSGTTGAPKGVQLTHRNVTSLAAAIRDHAGFPEGLRAISYLPMAHIAERICTHYEPMLLGWQVTTCANPRAVAEVIPQVRPSFLFSPPRLWEKLRAGVLARLEGAPEERQREARAALEAALEKVRLEQAGEPVPEELAARVAAAEEAIFAGIRHLLGLDEVQVAVVGAAPCPAEVIEFFHALGVPLAEVYGMSETTGVHTFNPRGAVRIGTAGTLLPGCEIRLSEEGEVLMRGPNVMMGYRNLPEKTAETIDADGWLHSGDVGEIDEDGYLRIVDRIKELIINAAGKNMSPANIEATLKSSSPLIGTACAIGDGRPYNVALITLDPDAATAFAEANGIAARSPEELARHEKVREEVEQGVERANQQLARVEQIKRFALLPDEWQPGGEELTPTMKLRRRPIAETYAAEIESLYAAR